MKNADIVGCHRRRRSFSITKQNPVAEVAPDRVFVATRPNQLWFADVTHVPTVQGWLYLGCVTEVLSRMALSWSMASHRKSDLAVDAVRMAVRRLNGRVPVVPHHSDRGGNSLTRTPISAFRLSDPRAFAGWRRPPRRLDVVGSDASPSRPG